MSWTKRQLVNQAFTQIGLANYTFDLQSEQLQTALRLLDGMMAIWNAQGLLLSYPIPTSPENSDLDEETNIPDRANEAVYLNLAQRIAMAFGRPVMPELKQFAWTAYQTLLRISTMPREMQFPNTLPRGAGNKPTRWTDENYFETPSDAPQAWET